MSAAAPPPSFPQAHGNLTLKEFCGWARIGKTMAYAEIATGRLAAMKCLGRTLIRREDAEAWRNALPRITPKTKNPPAAP